MRIILVLCAALAVSAVPGKAYAGELHRASNVSKEKACYTATYIANSAASKTYTPCNIAECASKAGLWECFAITDNTDGASKLPGHISPTTMTPPNVMFAAVAAAPVTPPAAAPSSGVPMYAVNIVPDGLVIRFDSATIVRTHTVCGKSAPYSDFTVNPGDNVKVYKGQWLEAMVNYGQFGKEQYFSALSDGQTC